MNPMMSMGIPNIPSQKELWKDEKNKYRHWIILFGAGTFVVFVMFLVSFIWNLVDMHHIKNTIRNSFLTKTPDFAQHLDELNSSVNTTYGLYVLGVSVLSAVLLGFSLAAFALSITTCYKKKSFAELSSFATFGVIIVLMFAFIQLISPFWDGTYIFDYPSGIFQFVGEVLVVTIGFVSYRVQGIRRMFLVSKKIEELQSSPQFQMYQDQMQQGGIQNPFFMQGMMPPVQQDNNVIENGVVNGSPKLTGSNNKATASTVLTEPSSSLTNMSTDDLKEIARKLSISGYNKMSNSELIKNIERATWTPNKKTGTQAMPPKKDVVKDDDKNSQSQKDASGSGKLN